MQPFANGAPGMGTGVRVFPGRFTVTGRRVGIRIRQRYAPMFSTCLTIQRANKTQHQIKKAIMKRTILAVVSVSVIGGATLYLNRQTTMPVSPAEPMAEAAPTRTPEDTRSVKTVVVQQTEPQV